MLSAMLDPASAREFLATSLPLFRTAGGPKLAALSIRDARLEKGWVQYYGELLDPPTGARRNLILVAEHLGNGALAKAARHVKRLAEQMRTRNGTLADLILHQPEAGLLVFPFPLDARLPLLVDATDPAQALYALAPLAPGAESCTVDVCRYLPGVRCQIRYTLRSSGGATVQLMGKMLREGRGERLFRATEQVAALYAENGDPCLTAPRALKYLPAWNMIVQEKMAGTTLNELLCDGTAGERHLEATARSIAILHQGKIPLDRRYSIAEEMDLIESCRPAVPLLNRIREVGAALKPSTPVPVHRDFYDKQLLVDGPRIALIDLDTLACGDAEIDLANFAAHLHLRALQNTGSAPAARWEHAFLSEYTRRAVRPPDAALLGFYFATACFRLACKYRPEPGGARIAAVLLSLAEDRLGGL